MPPLLPANEDAERVYLTVQDQYIFRGMNGEPFAINQMAIHKAIELYNVTDPIRCFEKVVNVSRKIIQEEKEARED